MSTLQQYQAEVVINNDTGASYMSLSALARVCKAHKETVKRSVTNYPSKEAEVLTGIGLRSVTLFAEDAVAAAIVKHNPELAKQLLQLGVRTLLHQLAGWKPQQAPKQMTQAELALWTVQTLVDNERRIERLEAFAPVESYYTLTAYYNYHKRQWDVPNASATGRKLRKTSEELGYVVKPVHDARYQSVNSYHENVLKQVLGF
jgi:hypothetical protein